MTHTKRNVRICVVLNVLFIWGNSLLPASTSATLSRHVKKILERILPFGDSLPALSHGMVRKIAHFTEFGCLGALLAWLYTMLPKTTILLLPCGVLVAGVDEFIQRFVPGRGASLVDVLIDASGALFGMCIVLAIYVLVTKKREKATE